jgi:Short C-terminal domain
MFMRRRPLLRAAAVGGTAYVAGKHMANKANDQAAYQDQQDQRISDLEAQQQAPPDQQYQQPPPQQAPPQYQQAPPPAAAPSMYDQLSQLATLHDQGALTDDEFTAAKAKLLGT